MVSAFLSLLSFTRSIYHNIFRLWKSLKPAQRLMVGLVGIIVFLFFIQLGVNQSVPYSEFSRKDRSLLQQSSLRKNGGSAINRAEFPEIRSQLPYQGDGFLVQYLPVDKAYHIRVTSPPYDESLDKAYVWLEQYGVSQENHTIIEGFSHLKN